MKKRPVLAALMMVAGICLCTNDQNSLQACVKEAAACPVSIKKEVKANPAVYAEDEDDPFYTFMNPVTRL